MLNNFDYRTNNFNLIRLFAAFQVVISHLHEVFATPSILKYISIFNGVPIFFTVSGFLIYWSFDHNPKIKSYSQNRFLRIYPALLFALFITCLLLLLFGTLDYSKLQTSSFWLWLVTQSTFIQEFTPTIIRSFGATTAPNPPLWTIGVEILLYFSIPIMFIISLKFSRSWKIIFFLTLGIISYIQNQTSFLSDYFSSLSDNGYYLIFIHPFLQFANFFWYFSIGIIFYLYKDKIIPSIAGKSLLFLGVYIIYCAILGYMGIGFSDNLKDSSNFGSYDPSRYALVAHFLLVLCIFSVAYSNPRFSSKILGSIDISYGLYIFHYLVLNTFHQLGWTHDIYIIPAIIISFLLAFFSWTFIEKRALKFKKKSLSKI